MPCRLSTLLRNGDILIYIIFFRGINGIQDLFIFVIYFVSITIKLLHLIIITISQYELILWLREHRRVYHLMASRIFAMIITIRKSAMQNIHTMKITRVDFIPKFFLFFLLFRSSSRASRF